MDQTHLELLLVAVAGLNTIITLYILWRARRQEKLRKAFFGLLGGVGTALVIVIGGMTASLLAQFFVDYPVEIALGIVMGTATCAVPLTTWLMQRV